ncbi:hypothetical protein B0I35DRAFT_409844 [Stachybotrys elegans]|uniref:DUF7924 domain-containing protein n=1 Tax=Stachybotrys elegans TaxID=80388 RepID=A0A8K0WRJ9_9HYPO|nr:hypothetical protein B0I35DRAFT_409844 [Stachybotrys elegans]
MAQICIISEEYVHYPHPPIDDQYPIAVSASRPSHSQKNMTTPEISKPKTSPYNRNFDLHLTLHDIHPTWKSRKPDLEEIKATLAVPRPSLSPSRFSEGEFESFCYRNDQAEDEDSVVANVLPAILGQSQANLHCARNTVFANLEPLTDGTVIAPKPDIYYGAYPDQLAKSTRNELAGHIMPSTMEDKPMAPNFFLEVEGLDGNPAVATRQARYDGAVGSRAMHSLQNYGTEKPQYDGKVYTFSSVYHGGMLQLCAHYVTAPTTEGGRPEYHMIRIRGFAMTDSRDTFVEGAGALRNMLDLAERYRSDFIQAANISTSTGDNRSPRRHRSQVIGRNNNNGRVANRPSHKWLIGSSFD